MPTCAEEGYDANYATWWALLAPPDTPEAIQIHLARCVQAGLGKRQRSKSFMASQGLEPNYVGPDEWQEFVQMESEKFRPVLEELDLAAD
ncbi:MAG: tripartite tricarboxylate transporter substrate-binding protein [Trueperaceae bacterium]|nr:tripartite tricarboxylate transporter substrate-binding protein [Trueperaceae bacterium]